MKCPHGKTVKDKYDCPKCRAYELFHKREAALDDIARLCEQTANSLFASPRPEWNMLLRFRDRLDAHNAKHFNSNQEPR